MRFVRGNVRDHIVTPKSTTALRSGTTERSSDREVKESTFARFSTPSDFRLFQHYLPIAEVAALLDHLVVTGEHLAAMVIRAARLFAILLPIARDLQHADKGPARL